MLIMNVCTRLQCLYHLTFCGIVAHIIPKVWLPTGVLLKWKFIFIQKTLVAASTTEEQVVLGFVFWEVETAQRFVDHQKHGRLEKVQSCCYRRKEWKTNKKRLATFDFVKPVKKFNKSWALCDFVNEGCPYDSNWLMNGSCGFKAFLCLLIIASSRCVILSWCRVWLNVSCPGTSAQVPESIAAVPLLSVLGALMCE